MFICTHLKKNSSSQVHQSCRSQSQNCSLSENALFTLPPASVMSSSGSLVWNVSMAKRCFFSHKSKSLTVLQCYTVKAPLTDTLISGQLSLRPPSQNPVSFNSHTNSVFSHSRKWPAPVTDNLFGPQGCPLTRASTVVN